MKYKFRIITKFLVLTLSAIILFLLFFLVLKFDVFTSTIISLFFLTIFLYLKIDFIYKDNLSSSSENQHKEESALNDNLRKVTRNLRKQIYDLHNLFEISVNLTSILEPKQLIRSLLPSLVGQLQTSGALVFLPNGNDEKLIYPVNYKGFSKEQISKFDISLENPIFKIFEKEKVALDLDKIDEKFLDEHFRILISHDVRLIAPLFHKSKVKGLIALTGKIHDKEFSQSDKEMFTLFSNLISVAFSNAILYKELETISVTDEMTGLYNYRFFRKQFEDEMSRARRFNHLLSLIIFDVDHFKNYNDSLGHPAGDEILRRIAKLLKSTIRQSDIAARYGGEEFCIILPEEDMEGAICFAERFRKKIENYPFPNEDVQPGGKLTISMGISSFPKHADEVQELINKADAALYKAKHKGRNQICMYEADKDTENK